MDFIFISIQLCVLYARTQKWVYVNYSNDVHEHCAISAVRRVSASALIVKQEATYVHKRLSTTKGQTNAQRCVAFVCENKGGA